MLRKTFFVAVALLSFGLGVSAARLSGIASQLESILLERLSPTPDFAELYASPVPPASLEEETDAVYAAFIKQHLVREDIKLIVLNAETTGGVYGGPLSAEQEAEHEERFLREWTESMPEAQFETLTDYLERDRHRRALRPLPHLGVRQVLVGADDVHRFFPEDGMGLGWDGFYLKYPGSPGLVTFSAVGFNRDRTQAFLYAGNSCGWLCGSGGYALLEKRDGRWLVVRQQNIWVS